MRRCILWLRVVHSQFLKLPIQPSMSHHNIGCEVFAMLLALVAMQERAALFCAHDGGQSFTKVAALGMSS
eukprot:479148-Amphidinium_carterae.1